MSGVALRQALPADEPFLFQLFCATRPELSGLPEALMQMQFRAQAMAYTAQYPELEHQLILLEPPAGEQGRPVGRILVATLPEAIRLVDIALLPAVQGRGIGTQLLLALQEAAAAAQKRLHLAVVATSPARRLYERLGFQATSQEGPRLQMIWTPGGATCTNP